MFPYLIRYIEHHLQNLRSPESGNLRDEVFKIKDAAKNAKTSTQFHETFQKFMTNSTYEKKGDWSTKRLYKTLKTEIENFEKSLKKLEDKHTKNLIDTVDYAALIARINMAFDRTISEIFTYRHVRLGDVEERRGLPHGKEMIHGRGYSIEEKQFYDLLMKYFTSPTPESLRQLKQFFITHKMSFFHEANWPWDHSFLKLLDVDQNPDFSAIRNHLQNLPIEGKIFLVKAGYHDFFRLWYPKNVKEMATIINTLIEAEVDPIILSELFIDPIRRGGGSNALLDEASYCGGITVDQMQLLRDHGVKFKDELVINYLINSDAPLRYARKLIFTGALFEEESRKRCIENYHETARYFQIRDGVLKGLQLPQDILPKIVESEIFGRGSASSDLGKVIAYLGGMPNEKELEQMCEERLRKQDVQINDFVRPILGKAMDSNTKYLMADMFNMPELDEEKIDWLLDNLFKGLTNERLQDGFNSIANVKNISAKQINLIIRKNIILSDLLLSKIITVAERSAHKIDLLKELIFHGYITSEEQIKKLSADPEIARLFRVRSAVLKENNLAAKDLGSIIAKTTGFTPAVLYDQCVEEYVFGEEKKT